MSATFSHPLANRARSPLFLSTRVFLQRLALSRRLAAGEEPASSPDLQLRAKQLLSASHRRVLAEGIQRVIDAAEERPRPYSSVVPLRRTAILAERQALLALAGELHDTDQRVSCRGVALVERLLTSGDSPFYVEGVESLDRSIRQAHGALFLG